MLRGLAALLLAAAVVLLLPALVPAAQAGVQPPIEAVNVGPMDVSSTTNLNLPICGGGADLQLVPVEILSPQSLGDCTKNALS
ncbi:hypothetical protein [Nonomuraea gerenzanensis]|uniref:hypothetical protein n=1 Tax=Nonomuraea gerenzanensis TaxID=93944 RepID=UPI001CDA20D3|nr:hypothetical protein [Nonomuraea gerenzanensis]UBU13243.1 hypothetical protein LCN96_54930 [Nonomuraea gerenzanensis]